jgi:hypothetical protein
MSPIHSFGSGVSASDSGSVSALIENGAKVINCIEHDAWQDLRGQFDDSELVSFFSSIGIKIDNGGPWLFADKSINDIFEITNVMMRTGKSQSWAMEQISHERGT